jgi:glyoxylase-like metal-dependent hydrolase (beta-lactamase superfamily II)
MNQERWARPSTSRSIRVGEVVISYRPDGFVELEPHRWYQLTDLPASFPMSESGHLIASVGAVVVEDPNGTVLVDVGLGPVHVSAEHTHPSLGVMAGGQLDDTAGTLAADVVAIATTHPHEDHVGWLRDGGNALARRLRERPVFAGRADVARLQQVTGLEGVVGLVGGEQISPTVCAVATPGHTPGHLAYLVESSGERAVILGDTFHSAAQLRFPDLTPWSDEEPDAAIRSRHHILDLLGEPGVRGVGYHFADVVFGAVGSDGRWEAAD